MDDPVIVVGGGICGLICAATIARGGRPVELVDASGALGGRADTSEQDGFLLNRGAHALYPSAERLLASAGVRVAGSHPNALKTKILFENEVFSLAPALAGRGPLGVVAGRRVAAALTRNTLGLPSRSAAPDAQSWTEEEGRTAAASGTLGALLRLATYAGDLSLLPVEIGRASLREASRRPVRYLDGGWGTIVERLAHSAAASGAEIHLGARATALHAEGPAAVVELADGSRLRGRGIVLAGLSPAGAARLLAGARGALPEQIATPRTVHAACLDVALSRLPDPGTTLLLGADEPLYLSVHSASARLAPEGGAVVQLLRYADGSQLPDEAIRERLRALLDTAQPGWRDCVLQERFAPRMVVAHNLPSPGEGLVDRPRSGDSGLPGVLLAGDWVGPAGWLAGASLASGVAAAAAVLGAPSVSEPSPAHAIPG